MKYHNVDFDTYFRNYPDANGYFGKYGGSYIPPQLRAARDEITDAYMTICKSGEFVNELRRIRRKFQGRHTPVSHLERLSSSLGNVQLYAKREDLNHTGAHKPNHCMGEALLAKYMGKKKVIAETGAGQHGVALATAAAYFGLECDIYMAPWMIKSRLPTWPARRFRCACSRGDRRASSPQGGGRGLYSLQPGISGCHLLHRFGGGPASFPHDGT